MGQTASDGDWDALEPGSWELRFVVESVFLEGAVSHFLWGLCTCRPVCHPRGWAAALFSEAIGLPREPDPAWGEWGLPSWGGRLQGAFLQVEHDSGQAFASKQNASP